MSTCSGSLLPVFGWIPKKPQTREGDLVVLRNCKLIKATRHQWVHQANPLMEKQRGGGGLTVPIQVIHALGFLLLLPLFQWGQKLLRGRLCRDGIFLPFWRCSSQSLNSQKKRVENKNHIYLGNRRVAGQLTMTLFENSRSHEFQKSVCIKAGPVHRHRVLKGNESHAHEELHA